MARLFGLLALASAAVMGGVVVRSRLLGSSAERPIRAPLPPVAEIERQQRDSSPDVQAYTQPPQPRCQELPRRPVSARFCVQWVYQPEGVHRQIWTLADLKPQVFLDGADLTGVQWPGVRLSGVKLWSFDFRCGNLAGARFERCDLRFCHFTNANLTHTSFRRSYLWDSDMRGARLAGADLRAIDGLASVWFAGATYDRHTRWPEGFEPRAHGARLVE